METAAVGGAAGLRARQDDRDPLRRRAQRPLRPSEGPRVPRDRTDGAAWVQGHLLEMGLARAYTLAAHRACAAELLAAERTAREARLGVWAEAAYAGARRPTLRRRCCGTLATFQLVEGRVAHVADDARQHLSQFRRTSRRRGFSVSLKLGDRDRLGAFPATRRASSGARCACAAGSSSAAEPVIDLSAAGEHRGDRRRADVTSLTAARAPRRSRPK